MHIKNIKAKIHYYHFEHFILILLKQLQPQQHISLRQPKKCNVSMYHFPLSEHNLKNTNLTSCQEFPRIFIWWGFFFHGADFFPQQLEFVKHIWEIRGRSQTQVVLKKVFVDDWLENFEELGRGKCSFFIYKSCLICCGEFGRFFYVALTAL